MAGLPKLPEYQTKWQDIEKPENIEEAKKVAEENKEAIDKKEEAIKKPSVKEKISKTLSDADDTLAQSGVGNEAVAAKVEQKKEAEPVEDVKTEEVEVPEEIKNEIFNTDEGKVAQNAIDSGNISELENVVDPESGNSVIVPTYDEDGRVVEARIGQPLDAELFSQKTALILTLISCVISALSGGMFPPINFLPLRWDEAENKRREMENQAVDIYNEGVRKENQNVTDIRKTEMGLKSAANKDLYSQENINRMGRAKEAEAGSTAMQQAEMNTDLAKTLKDRDIGLNLEIIRLNNEQQITLSKLLYDQEVSKVFDQIKKMKAEGMKTDEIAKYISSMNGTTTLARGLGYAKDVTGMATDLVNAVGEVVPGNSDKNCKVFDAKPVNNTLLKKAFKWR